MNGFSLIEVVCACGLLALLAATSVYSTTSLFQDNQMRMEAELSAALIRSARSKTLHKECAGPMCHEPSLQGIIATGRDITALEDGQAVASYPIRHHDLSSEEIVFHSDGLPESSTTITFSSGSYGWMVSVGRDGSIRTSRI
jgi:Tfp pilus assembly protein FimT